MAAIQVCALPERALLAKYARDGAYTDCYATEVARPVSQAEYVEAFYTGAVFKLERLLLAGFVSRPSTDAQARELAAGVSSDFAAWRVEGRSADQLLMCDLSGRTRSWFMVAPVHAAGASTRLYFGSAVLRLDYLFRALLGFHRLYSRVLLQAARSRLTRSTRR